MPDYKFRFADCTSLAFYAVADAFEEFGPSHKSFVAGEAVQTVLRADTAPYCMADRTEDVLARIGDALERPDLDDQSSKDLRRAYQWVQQCGTPYIAYQLEPPPIAGKGTARRLGLAAE